MSVLKGLEPASVFRFFEEICGIPHGSCDTKRISDSFVRCLAARQLRLIYHVLIPDHCILFSLFSRILLCLLIFHTTGH